LHSLERAQLTIARMMTGRWSWLARCRSVALKGLCRFRFTDFAAINRKSNFNSFRRFGRSWPARGVSEHRVASDHGQTGQGRPPMGSGFGGRSVGGQWGAARRAF